MWKIKSVQVSTERGSLTTTLGTLSRLSWPEWNIVQEDREIICQRDGARLRIPRDLVVIEEVEVQDEKPQKKGKEAA
jgi:hypothetical protein